MKEKEYYLVYRNAHILSNRKINSQKDNTNKLIESVAE